MKAVAVTRAEQPDPMHRPKTDRLTVIVPVHNAAPWLHTCIDSLLAQTRRIDEIIAIDDGSTDSSSAILADYAQNHSHLKILTLDGAGASVARNTGLDAATGDWLAFVDADDWVEPQAYERMLNLALENGLDIALANGRYHFEGMQPDHLIYRDPPLLGTRSGGDWFAHKLENGTFLHMVWLHLYRREFVESNNLRFTPGITYEDVIWSTRALVLAQRVSYLDDPFFVYRKVSRRPDAGALDTKLVHIIESSKTNARELERIARGVSDPRLAHLIRWQLVDGGLSIFHRANQFSNRRQQRSAWRATWDDDTLGLLWRNAVNFRQRKKLVGRAVRALVAGWM